MSFIAKLFGRRQQRPQQAGKTRAVYTHEDGEFVHVSHVGTRESDADDEADVSKWEMAQVLGHLDVKVEQKMAKLRDIKTKRRQQQQQPPAAAAVAAPAPSQRYVDDRYVIEDPSELDMFDDKLNRVIKRSHRRKMNFFQGPTL